MLNLDFDVSGAPEWVRVGKARWVFENAAGDVSLATKVDDRLLVTSSDLDWDVLEFGQQNGHRIYAQLMSMIHAYDGNTSGSRRGYSLGNHLILSPDEAAWLLSVMMAAFPNLFIKS